MLFPTVQFAAFFAIVYALYLVLTRRAQNVLLLVASYVFYAAWDWRFLSLLWISTLVDFTVARRMPGSGARTRKLLLLASLVTNLGILGFFKYAGFFVESAAMLLEAIGFQAHPVTLGIVLPVGISFYTFQTLAYTIDVYRGRMRPANDVLDFAVYVAFFPQLVAGPIERAQRLLPQLERKRIVDANMLSSGALLFLIGLVRKVVVADGVAPLVEQAFADPSSHTGVELWVGAMLFAVQIYSDFAGYSDMARGLGRMLGIELMVNFEHPYFATNITQFWRRWHISLSTWLRDYLYIPLGGNRGGRLATYRNLMVTMLLGGLWHGAAWTFILWGGVHWAALAAHRWLVRDRAPQKPVSLAKPALFVRSLAGWALTMAVVLVAWVLFRAESFALAFEYLRGMASFSSGMALAQYTDAAIVVLLLLVIDVTQRIGGSHTVVLQWPAWMRGVVYAALILSLVFLPRPYEIPFLYFQF